jgi:indolepyruvate ferredoxin oxidoreductase beta subunit
VLIGGWMSPTICHGEADILLGFEPLETLRALPYLAPGGFVLSSSEFVPPLSVSMGRECLPEVSAIEAAARKVAGKCWFLPLQALGREAGSVQSGNTALLGALCAAGIMPFGPEALRESIRKYLPPKAVEVNLRALELGVGTIR